MEQHMNNDSHNESGGPLPQRAPARTPEEIRFFNMVRQTFAEFEQNITQGGSRHILFTEPEEKERLLGIRVFLVDNPLPEFSYYISVDRNGTVEETYSRGPDDVL